MAVYFANDVRVVGRTEAQVPDRELAVNAFLELSQASFGFVNVHQLVEVHVEQYLALQVFQVFEAEKLGKKLQVHVGVHVDGDVGIGEVPYKKLSLENTLLGAGIDVF